MNKIFNINLGGYPFTIDDDAYKKLNTYLRRIEDHFSTSEGCEEIISDIESRLAELFNDSLKGQPIVSIKDINLAIDTMGTPEDFGAVGYDDDYEANASHDNNYKTGKRFFRDPEEKLIGGVCSGLAAYFGVEDPLWVRLLAVLFFFAGGIAFPLYIVLWILMPEARTAADKLAMRGEKIDINNIAKTVEEEFDNITDTFSDLDQKFRSKKKSNFKSYAFFPLRLIAKAFSIVGSLAVFMIGIAKGIIKPLFSLFLVFILISIALSWVGLVVGSAFLSPFVSFLSAGSSLLGYGGLISGLFAIGIPMFAVMYFISKYFGRTKLKSGVASRIGLIWMVSLGLFIAFGVNYGVQWNRSSSITNTKTIDNVEEGLLTFRMDGNRYNDESFLTLDDIALDKNTLRCDNISVVILETEDELPSVQTKISSYGKKKSSSFKRINEVELEGLKIENNMITIPRYFTLNKGSKYRGQEVEFEFRIPKSYEINKDVSVNRFIPYNYRDLASK